MATIEQIRLHGTRTRRVCAGLYEVSALIDQTLTVTLNRRDDLGGWIAAANWDRFLYTDVMPTKARAKLCAINMIEDGANG